MLLAQKKTLFLQKVQDLYQQWQKITEQLSDITTALPLPKGLAATQADIEEQLQRLFAPDTWLHAPVMYLERYPIYLDAILLRLQKAQRAPQKEETNLAEIKPLWQSYWTRDLAVAKDAARWALEELRIAIFAQEIKTAYSISPKKFRKMLEEGIS